MAAAAGSESYDEKRDFRATPEPEGAERPDHAPADRPFFVIQEHDASSHHFDLRLEVDGALVSWAVPKGASTDPSEKRLAVRTEDHPLAYGGFEGVIPEGQYGAGTVVAWDTGPYRNLRTVDMATSLEQGQVEVRLEGEKLRGGWALVHAKPGGDEDGWLLVKMDDEEADARRRPTSTEPESVLSGRTLEEVAREESENGEESGKAEEARR